MDRKLIIAVDLGGTNLRAALLDVKFRIKDRVVLSTRKFHKKRDLISAIISAIIGIKESNKLKKTKILGVGLGLPGPIDTKRGVVHFLPNIAGWRRVNLTSILKKELKLAVYIDNDAKLMALAEYKLGRAYAFNNALCITLGTGIGGGLILEGRLFRGLDNAAGEFGHLPINEDGPRCNCGGIACLESYIGNNRILKETRRAFKKDIPLEKLSLLARQGNKRARDIWLKAGSQLGIALSGVVNLLNLDAVIVGGGVANAGKILFDQVKKTIKERAMSVQARRVKVFKARLGNDAGLIGAAILVKENIKKINL